MNMKKITMAHGSGGKATNDLIKNLIVENFSGSILGNLGDSAYINLCGDLAFSSDSFVVQPEFFPGGDIGELSVYGTCNDLAVSGAVPMYLSFSLILPNGYIMDDLEKIVKSAAKAADEVGIEVVCGDTKVINSHSSNTPIINTAGIGVMGASLNDYSKIKPGDKVILTSDIARHGMAIFSARKELELENSIQSDCGNLYSIFEKTGYDGIKFSRDATRGGVAAVLHEISDKISAGFYLYENMIPIQEDVVYLCEFLGFDPLVVANEGVAVIISEAKKAQKILNKIRQTKMGRNASIVGEVYETNNVVMETKIGGVRTVEMPSGDLLPRIC